MAGILPTAVEGTRCNLDSPGLIPTRSHFGTLHSPGRKGAAAASVFADPSRQHLDLHTGALLSEIWDSRCDSAQVHIYTVYIYIYIYLCIHMNMCLYVYIYIYTHTCTHVYLSVCSRACIYLSSCLFVFLPTHLSVDLSIRHVFADQGYHFRIEFSRPTYLGSLEFEGVSRIKQHSGFPCLVWHACFEGSAPSTTSSLRPDLGLRLGCWDGSRRT